MGGDTALLRIHPSRIVHLVGRKRREYGNSARMGQSVVSAVMDDLKAVDAVMANVADMTMEAKVDVVKISGLLNKVTNPEELAALQSKIQLAMMTKATNGALVMDMEEEDWQQKQMGFATIPDVIDRFQIAAAGAAQIPRSRLFGVQTGGLGDSGKSDTVDYYDRIKSMQENEIQPPMTVLDKMIIKTALGSIPEEVHYNWRSLWQMDDKTKQEIGKMIVDRYAVAVEKIGFPEELAFEQVVNELTEAGVSPGLEQAAEGWAASVGGDEGADDAGDLDDGGGIVTSAA
jgi:phage-related protein (TIGR01555 family)